jgi:5-methylcytosine-specific restriction endonuclease McrA
MKILDVDSAVILPNDDEVAFFMEKHDMKPFAYCLHLNRDGTCGYDFMRDEKNPKGLCKKIIDGSTELMCLSRDWFEERNLREMSTKRRALALNKSYLPLRLVNPYEAICKLYEGKVTAIASDQSEHTWDGWVEYSKNDQWPEDQWFLMSSSGRVAVPRIVRYVVYDKIPKARLKLNRRNIYERDDHTCYMCGNKYTEDNLSIDHVVPASRGGKRTWTNLATCCKSCNRKKANHLLSELKYKPKFMPYEPKSSNIAKIKSEAAHKFPEWKSYGV